MRIAPCAPARASCPLARSRRDLVAPAPPSWRERALELHWYRARREMRLGRHALWLAWDDDLTRFLRDCRPAYDPARIRDPYWRAFVAALPPERDPWLTPVRPRRSSAIQLHGIQRLIATGRLVARRWGGRYSLRRSAIAPCPASLSEGNAIVSPCPPSDDIPPTDSADCPRKPKNTS